MKGSPGCFHRSIKLLLEERDCILELHNWPEGETKNASFLRLKRYNVTGNGNALKICTYTDTGNDNNRLWQ